MIYEIELIGVVPPLKNEKTPIMRNGKLTIVTKKKVHQQMDCLKLQIPGYMRDLNLIHPDVTFLFYLETDRSDRDSMVSALLDILRDMGVIKDDNCRYFNGHIHTLPAILGNETKAIVTLEVPD